MLRKLSLALLPLALLAAACSGGGGDSQDAGPPDQTTEPTAVRDSGSGDTDGAGSPLLSALNPLALLGALDAPPASEPADPELKAALLNSDDLPSDFAGAGEFGMAVPTEYGDVTMAMNVFTNGDPASDDFADAGTTVISAAMLLPPEALDEDLSELSELTEADFQELQGEVGALGEFAQLEPLDADGLGDGGTGMRMEMDFGAIFGVFGMPEDEEGPTGIAFDTYMFFRGEHMLMVMVMSPNDGDTGVDARDLADLLDDKAEDAF